MPFDLVLRKADGSILLRCPVTQFPIGAAAIAKRAEQLFGSPICCQARQQTIITLLRQELWQQTADLPPGGVLISELSANLQLTLGAHPSGTRLFACPHSKTGYFD